MELDWWSAKLVSGYRFSMIVAGQERGKQYRESRLKVVSLPHLGNAKIPHWTNTKSMEGWAMAEEGAFLALSLDFARTEE